MSEEDTGPEDSFNVENQLVEEHGAVPETLVLPSTVTETHHCGCGPFHPKWLQLFASAKFFTFLLCTYSVIEGTLVTGFRTVVVSTLEKRYHFSSSASSIVLGAFDFAVVISVVFYSYFSQKAHKPRILGIGQIILGVGALTYTCPQFLLGEYEVESSPSYHLESCDINDNVTHSSCNPANYAAYMFFLVGDFLIGIGAAPLFTVGVSFVDDIVHPKYVPIHLGLFYVSAIIGPSIGYGLGGAFLSIYVDPWKTTNLTESDPGWVGAWWLCFLVGGIISILFAVPFLMFPRQLHNSQLVLEARKKEMAIVYTSKHGDERPLWVQVKVFPAHMKKICQSLTWLFTTISITCLFFSLDGMLSFGPKYLESQFGVTASKASLYLGALAIPTAGLGVIGGALLVYLLKSKGRRAAVVNWVVVVLAIMPGLGAFIPSCPDVLVAGINRDYPNSSFSSGSDVLLSSCNYDCNCTSTVFEPVCGADGITYFSPCRAGCQKFFQENDPNRPVFENCSCVREHLFKLGEVSNSTVTNGECGSNCNTMPVFMLLIGIFVLLVFSLKTPVYMVTLRSVAEEQRTLALGVQSVIFRSFGSIPGPIVFGAVIDSACQYFERECGTRGNCWVYNNHLLSTRAIIIGVFGLLGNVLFAFLAWIFYPKTKESEHVATVEEDELQLLDEDSDKEVSENGVNDDHHSDSTRDKSSITSL